jgi:hypothetical protein
MLIALRPAVWATRKAGQHDPARRPAFPKPEQEGHEVMKDMKSPNASRRPREQGLRGGAATRTR